jgi:hypothetical protein
VKEGVYCMLDKCLGVESMSNGETNVMGERTWEGIWDEKSTFPVKALYWPFNAYLVHFEAPQGAPRGHKRFFCNLDLKCAWKEHSKALFEAC